MIGQTRPNPEPGLGTVPHSAIYLGPDLSGNGAGSEAGLRKMFICKRKLGCCRAAETLLWLVDIRVYLDSALIRSSVTKNFSSTNSLTCFRLRLSFNPEILLYLNCDKSSSEEQK